MPRNQFQVGQKIAFGGLILLFLGLAGCEGGGVGARDLSGSSGSSITMPRELRTALEEALPTGSSGGQLPDADEAFLYGVGIGAIQRGRKRKASLSDEEGSSSDANDNDEDGESVAKN